MKFWYWWGLEALYGERNILSFYVELTKQHSETEEGWIHRIIKRLNSPPSIYLAFIQQRQQKHLKIKSKHIENIY